MVGFNRPLETIHFVCSRCGRKDVNVKTMLIDIDRPPKLHVWVAMPFKL